MRILHNTRCCIGGAVFLMPLRNKILWEGGIFALIPKSEYSLSNEFVDYGIMIKEKKHVKKRKNLIESIYRTYEKSA